MSSKRFSSGSYVDVKNPDKEWCAGKVLKVKQEGYKIRLDGYLQSHDITVAFDSPDLAPFRQYTRGYTGPDGSLRDDPAYDLENLGDILSWVQKFTQTDYEQFDAPTINRILRGKIFFFIDAFFTKRSISLLSNKLLKIIEFLVQVLEMIANYLKRYPPSLRHKFEEGIVESQKIVQKSDVAYAHFIFEALDLLTMVFGLCGRCSTFFTSQSDENFHQELKQIYKDPNVVTERTSSYNGSFSNRNPTYQEMISEVLINKFSALRGFEYLLKILDVEINKPSNNGNGIVELPNRTAFLVLPERILKFLKSVFKKLQTSKKQQLLVKFQELFFRQLEDKAAHNPRNIDVDKLTHLFDEFEVCFSQLGDTNLKLAFFKNKETFELNLFLKFLKSSKLEDRLFGLNQIEDYMKRVEHSLTQDSIFEDKFLYYFDRGSFLDWILKNQVFDLIYNKLQHGELIRSSLDLQRFIAKNYEHFPAELIEIIWKGSLESNEQVTRVIYEGIIQLAPSLDLKSALLFFSKFQTATTKQQHEEPFVLLICQFTEQCLGKILTRGDSGLFKIKTEISKDDQNFTFGLPLMFEMIMDNYPISPALSEIVLSYFKKLIREFFAVKLFFKYSKSCENNIKKKISLFQSLSIINEFLTQVGNLNSESKPLQERVYEQINAQDLITDILTAYTQYYSKVREKLKAIKKTTKENINSEKFQSQHFVGKFSHESNVSIFLTVLQKIAVNQFKPQPLSFELLENLWNIFFIKSNFEFETSLFLQALSYHDKNHYLFRENELFKIFTYIICSPNHFPPKYFTPEKYKCFEFFFLLVNSKQNKIQLEQTSSNRSIQVLDSKNIIGLDILWRNFLECQDKAVSQDFANLLVDLFAKHNQKEIIDLVFSKIENLLQEKDLPAIEKCFWFLDNVAQAYDEQVIKEHRKYFSAQARPNEYNKNKTSLQAKFYPYNHLKQCDFHPKEKLGHVKLTLAKEFEIHTHEFDIMIEDEVIADTCLREQLDKRYYYEGITLLRRNLGQELTIWELLGTQPYIQKIFSVFESFDPSALQNLSSFFKKISIQTDEESSNSQNLFSIITGPLEINASNIHQVYYLVSIIYKLVLIDPYYWKMKIDLKAVKSEWSIKFVSQGQLASLMNLLVKTDLKKINNLLFINVLSLIYQILHFFLTSFDETQSLWSDQLFCKTLDTLLYSSKYVSSEPNSSNVQEYCQLVETLRLFLEDMLKFDDKFCNAFLLYPNLKNLYFEIFINLPQTDADTIQVQERFKEFMNTFLRILKNTPEKQLSNRMFKILFENLPVAAIESPKPATKALQYLAEILSQFNLKKDFDCAIDISFLISQITSQSKKLSDSVSEDQSKIIDSFTLLWQYLSKDESTIETLSEASLELAKELLTKGLFGVGANEEICKPKYHSKDLVALAFKILALLTKNNQCFRFVTDQLVKIHQEGIWRKHTYSSWNMSSSKSKRKSLVYSGLKNLGCICYMNSTVQQLFMIPKFQKAILDSKYAEPEKLIDENTLLQLKKLFYGMKLTEKEHFNPKLFCLSFKGLDGRPTNIREQKDAFEFLSLLLDRLEETAKTTERHDFIKDLFGGSFANQITSKDCSHAYNREEAFIGVNLVVKDKQNIQESLDSFIQEQTLAGDDAYFCEKCNKKVRAIKQVSFKNLPQYLIFGLNRFEYDIYRNLRIKLNDYYEFSQEIDLKPYVREYLLDPNNVADDQYHYQLKGVVIHAGGAESGHYFSIIKDPHAERWIEFNDTRVSEFDIKDLPHVAFGDKTSSRASQSAYILVYEKVEPIPTKKKVLLNSKAHDKMEIETGEIHKDEFVALQNKIAEKNKKLFLIERIFSTQYHEFLLNLVEISQPIIQKEITSPKPIRLNKAFRLIWTVFITATLRSGNQDHQQQLFEWLYDALNKNDNLCQYTLGCFTNVEVFTEMVLQCPKNESKKLLINLLSKAFNKVYQRDKRDKTWLQKTSTGEFTSAASNFLSFLTNALPKTKKYHDSINSYISLIQTLLKKNLDMKKLLIYGRFLGKVGYYLFPSEYIEKNYPIITKTLNVTENEPFLQYNKTVEVTPTNDFQDFEHSPTADFQKLFQLFWQLLRYCRIEDREDYSKFLYHQPSIDYCLKEPELKALQLNSSRIEKMFTFVDRNDRKTKRIICKIVAFFSYGSPEDSRASFDFIKNGFKSGKNIEDIFQMIQVISKVKDHFQIERNRIFLQEIIAFLQRQVDQITLNDVIRILKKLINSNSCFTSILKEKTSYISEIIRVLNNAQEENDPFHRVESYLVREEVNKELARHKDFFDDLRSSRKTDFANDSDSQNEEDSFSQNFKRGQSIRYYDPTLKRAFRGTIENVYENLIKVKLITGDTPTYKWLDEEDSSDITVISEK